MAEEVSFEIWCFQIFFQILLMEISKIFLDKNAKYSHPFSTERNIKPPNLGTID